MKRAFAAALAILCLSGCGSPASIGPGAAEPERAMALFNTVTLGEEYAGTDLYYYSFPTVEVETGLNSEGELNSALEALLTPGPEALGPVTEAARAAYGALSDGARRGWDSHGFGFAARAEPLRLDTRVLSLRLDCSRSLGGPYPSDWQLGVNFDIVTAKRLTAGDISARPAELAEAVREYVLSAAPGLPYAQALYGLEGFASGALGEGRWCLTGGGLEVFAAPGEIAPRAAGSVSFEIPYSGLAGLIKPEYLPDGALGGPGAFSLSEGAEGAALTAYISGSSSFTLTPAEPVTGIFLTELVSDGLGSWVESYPMLALSGLDAGEGLGVTVAAANFIAYGLSYGAGEEYTVSLVANRGLEPGLNRA